jgi:hypothetical protein
MHCDPEPTRLKFKNRDGSANHFALQNGVSLIKKLNHFNSRLNHTHMMLK